MQINLGDRIPKIFFGFVLVGIVLILCAAGSGLSTASAQGMGTLSPDIPETVATPSGTPQPGKDPSVNIKRFSDQVPIQDVYNSIGPSTPSPSYKSERQPAVLPEVGEGTSNLLTVPGSANGPGCGQVGGVMLAAYYDRNGYSEIYKGPANGGVMPLDERLFWPEWTSGGDTWQSNPLMASQMGVDGRTTRGHIEDFWVSYDSDAQDPWKTNGWAQHTWDSVGDFMYTSQTNFISKDGEKYPLNRDGVTRFYELPPLVPTPIGYNAASPYTAELMSSNSQPDGTLGMKLFYQSRGYAVGTAYNQPTDNIVAGGFSFAQYKAEIDAGRPVYIGLAGHAVVGIGYDAASNLVYLYDGWDYNTHSMPWGGSYAGMEMQFVSIVYPVPGTPHLYTISGNVGVANATITYTGGLTTADANGNYSFTVTESWFGTVTPSKPGFTFEPATRSYANIVASVIAQNYNDGNLLKNPGFESGTSDWIETHFYSSPFCTVTTCGGNGTHTGSGWAWFGGITASDTETLSQTVTIPNSSSASLDFYLWINNAAAGSDASDLFTVKVDGTTVFSTNATQIYYYYSRYRPINVNLSSYADGKQHEIKFSSVTSGQVVSFFLDDVSLTSAPLTTPPGSFNKTSPSNGATNLPTNPTLTWEKSANLTSYQYCFDKTNDNACSNWIDNGTATSVTLGGLDYNSTYYWHVRAKNNYGETYSIGSNTTFWSFKTIPEVVIPTPLSGPPLPVMTSQILTASSLVNETGTKSGSLASLNVQDQAGTADNPASYVSFQTPEGSYSGYLSFTLPQGAEARTISSMLLQVNFKRPATNQIWTWSVYDPASGMWINLGNSVGTTAGQWQSLVLRIPQPWRFVSPTNEIRIQLRSNNNNGDLKIDYEALHITYLSVPDTIVVPPVNTRRPGGF